MILERQCSAPATGLPRGAFGQKLTPFASEVQRAKHAYSHQATRGLDDAVQRLRADAQAWPAESAIRRRARGTSGGSVADNDPAADDPAAVLTHDVQLCTDRRER